MATSPLSAQRGVSPNEGMDLFPYSVIFPLSPLSSPGRLKFSKVCKRPLFILQLPTGS